MARPPLHLLAASARRLRPLAERLGPVVADGVRWVLARLDRGRDRVGDRWRARESRRHAELRRRSAIPLPNLFVEHPETRGYVRRELGLRQVGLDEIEGTAVAGASQRGSDFTPLKDFRSTNWQYRFQAIRNAMDRMSILPPIDVLRYAGKYWIEDGHNRVAAALYAGQREIDASVTELRPPGAPSTEQPASLAPMLESGRDLRAAGSGRFTRTVPELVTEEDFDAASEERERVRDGSAGAVGLPEEPEGSEEADAAEGSAEGSAAEGSPEADSAGSAADGSADATAAGSGADAPADDAEADAAGSAADGSADGSAEADAAGSAEADPADGSAATDASGSR